MRTHKTLVRKMLKQPAVKAEHDAQVEEFALLDELLKARRRADLAASSPAAVQRPPMATRRPKRDARIARNVLLALEKVAKNP